MGSRSRFRTRAGFTLVEILFATAIMVVVAAGIFHMYRSINRQASQAAWISEAQKQSRTAMKRIHDELSKAAYWTRLTPKAVIYLKIDGSPSTSDSDKSDVARQKEEAAKQDYWVRHFATPDQDNEWTPNGGDQPLLSWYQCDPERSGFLSDNQPGYLAECALVLRGNVLTFQRTHQGGSAAGANPVVVDLATNVEKVVTHITGKADATDAVAGSVVRVDLTLHHPNRGVFPDTKVNQTITARVPVGYQGQS